MNDFYFIDENLKNKDDIKHGNDNLSEVAYSEFVSLSEAPDRLNYPQGDERVVTFITRAGLTSHNS